jgi:hypothetical protein
LVPVRVQAPWRTPGTEATWEIRNATGCVLRVEGALSDPQLELVLSTLFVPS